MAERMNLKGSPAKVARHVLMVLENNPYPQDGRVRKEASALVAAGIAVTVIAPRADGQPKSDVMNGVSIERFRQAKERDGAVGYLVEYTTALVAVFVSAVRIRRRHRFDVIHAHNPPDLFFPLAWLFGLFGVRFVFDHHDLSPEMYDQRFGDDASALVRKALVLSERFTFRAADRVVSTNDSYAEIARERGGVDPGHVTVVRNGPDLSRVRVVSPDQELLGRADHIIGYVGEMAPQDGVDHLIRALAHMKDDLGRDDFFCVLIGGGVEVAALSQLADELGLSGHTWFTGPIHDDARLMAYLSATDVCVTPDPKNAYTDVSTTVKTAEYMALGKPVVAFDLTENRRTATDAALYARPNDVRDLAARIVDLMGDPELRRTLGERGRARVDQHLAWPHQSARLVEMYEDLLGLPRVAERS